MLIRCRQVVAMFVAAGVAIQGIPACSLGGHFWIASLAMCACGEIKAEALEDEEVLR